MKNLFLVRHAKATRDSAFSSDIDRPLTERGYTDAVQVSKALKNKKVKIDLIITDSAVRAYSTALIFAGSLNYDLNKISIDNSVYDASSSDLKKVIDDIDDKYSSVMLFGHNPGFEHFANYLMDEEIAEFPTSGVIHIEFPINLWKEVIKYSGKLRSFIQPDK